MYRYIEYVIAACLYYSGLVQFALWWRQRSGKCLVILNYHRASSGDLKSQMLYLHRHYRILPLDTALEELYAPNPDRSLTKDRRIPLALTFDDGNRDNYTHGFKLASELQIPITLFLLPGYIENGQRFWWNEADTLVLHAQQKEVTIAGRRYRLDRKDDRMALLQTIDDRVRFTTSVAEREQFLGWIQNALAVPDLRGLEEQATLPLTWTEAREMQASNWVTFGAHTVNHPILAYLSDPAEVEYEICESRKILERELGCPIRSFAYPVGKAEHIEKYALYAIQHAGYRWGLTTIHGINTPKTDPFLLRRFIVDADQHWLSIAVKASGLWNLLSFPIHHSFTIFRNTLRSLKFWLLANQSAGR